MTNWPQQYGELELGMVLSRYGLIIYPYTYQGTARILLREMSDEPCVRCNVRLLSSSPGCDNIMHHLHIPRS